MYWYFVKLSIAFGCGGTILGASEVYQKRSARLFSNSGDTIHEGAARGAIRSILFLGKSIQQVPKIWVQEWGK